MKKAKEQYTVQLDPDFVAKLDVLADKVGVSRSQLMRNLMESAYEDTVMLESIGLIAAFKFGQKLIKEIKKKIASGNISLDENGELKIR